MPRAGFTADQGGNHNHGGTIGGGGHSHSFTVSRASYDASSGAFAGVYLDGILSSRNVTGNGAHTHTIPNSGNHTHNVIGGDSETRPDNMALLYIIKY